MSLTFHSLVTIHWAHFNQLRRCSVLLVRCVVAHETALEAKSSEISDQLGFLLHQEELLRAENRTWSGNSDPANELLSWNFECLHRIKSNESASTAKSCLTVDSDSSRIRLAEVPLADVQEIFYDIFRRIRPVDKEQIIMSYALSDELFAIVFRFI